MRDKSEKKEKSTAIRMTEQQHQLIQKKAKEAGKSMGSYLVDRGVQENSSLTPEQMVNIQNLVNTACEAVKEYAPEKLKAMQKGANELWLSLK